MQLHNYRDFQAQRNCPQPIEDDFDEHNFGYDHSHHYQYQINHDEQPRSYTSRPAPKDRPIVFPGDLRFHKSIETKSGDVELMAAASQDQVIREFKSPTTIPTGSTPFLTNPTSVLASPINPDNCGLSLSTRIQGGEKAQPGQYPWLARIAYRNKSK